MVAMSALIPTQMLIQARLTTDATGANDCTDAANATDVTAATVTTDVASTDVADISAAGCGYNERSCTVASDVLRHDVRLYGGHVCIAKSLIPTMRPRATMGPPISSGGDMVWGGERDRLCGDRH